MGKNKENENTEKMNKEARIKRIEKIMKKPI